MRVAIIGTGLIGGSLGLALSQAGAAEEITLWDPDPDALRIALERGAGTSGASDAASASSSADIVVVAAPVDAIVDLFPAIAVGIDEETVVSDVGSSKAAIAQAGESTFGEMFVGGHPMAGSERHGIEAASAHLFEGASWILTPSARTSAEVYGRVTEVVSAVGAQPVALPVGVHDTLLAQISHLPQLVASLLVDLAAAGSSAQTLLPLAGGGFRDVTRIAGSSPAMWLPILSTNRQAIVEALTGFGHRLEELKGWLEEGDWAEIERFMGDARTARLELFQKASLQGATTQLSLLVPDRPGVLAEVTTAAGELAVNLEDLRIFHSTEGGRGRLDLEVTGEQEAARLGDRLAELGYDVFSGWHE